MNILYISYDGVLEPLGRSQVLSYLVPLAAKHTITLISYEKASDYDDLSARQEIIELLEKAGISWKPLRYHKAPTGPATAYDILQGIVTALWLVKKRKIHIIHARSYVSAVVALALKKMFSTKFLFDMRGFWADERIDGNIWSKESRVFHVAKWFERKFLLNADVVVSLTHAGVEVMSDFSYLRDNKPDFHVITTCTDLTLFDYARFPEPISRKKNEFVFGYVGSAGVWYLFDETLMCFKQLLKKIPKATLKIINKGEHDFINKKLLKHDIPSGSVELFSASREVVAAEMVFMDAGVFFIKPVFSKMASAPTKLGEFLGCGIPCLSNSGVGDMASILTTNQVGIALDDFSEASIDKGIDELLQLCRDSTISKRCRETALSHFSLDEGVKQYDAIYQKLS